MLVLSLALLAAANYFGAPLWTITLGAAVVLVAGNAYVHYFRPWLRSRRYARRQPQQQQQWRWHPRQQQQQQQQQGIRGPAAAATPSDGDATVGRSGAAAGNLTVRPASEADEDVAAAAVQLVTVSQPAKNPPDGRTPAQTPAFVEPAAAGFQQQLPSSGEAATSPGVRTAVSDSGGGPCHRAVIDESLCGGSAAVATLAVAAADAPPSTASTASSREASTSFHLI